VKLPLCLALSALLTTPVLAQKVPQNSIVGYWKTQKKEDENGTATIKIAPCGEDANKLCGKIVALEEPIDPETKDPKIDKRNPDKSLRDRPVMGLQILKGFEHVSDTQYENGSIYSPRTGKTYSCELRLNEEEQLEVTEYLLFFSNKQAWTRTNAPTSKNSKR
jgi:uncharacterized protein (DUF2147 family)